MTVLAEGQDEIRAAGPLRRHRVVSRHLRKCVRGGSTCSPDGTIHAEVPAGDHDIVLVRVDRLRADPAAAPLPFRDRRFRRLTII